MTKVAEQNIPSEFRQLWSRIFNPNMDPTTGFNYSIDDYQYCSLQLTRQKGWNSNKKGTEYPKIGKEQEDVRCRLTKASGWANESVLTGGATPPDSGPRDKKWWYDNNPIENCYWNDYAVHEAQPHLDFHRIAPWGLDPTIWISAQGNHRLERWNGRTMTYIDSTIGGVGPGEDFGNITRACCDEIWVYVPDYSNDRIHILNKDTLEYKEFKTETSLGEYQFNSIQQLVVDDVNLFIQQYAASSIIVVNKVTFDLVTIIGLTGPEDWTIPEAQGITLDYNFVSIADYINGMVKVYSRKTFQKVNELTIRNYQDDPVLYANAIVSDGQLMYCLDSSHGENITIDIGSGKEINTNEYPDPVAESLGLSGDLVFVMGQADPTLYKTARPTMAVISTVYNPGLGPGQFNINMGVCGPQAFQWDAC